MLHKLKSLE